MSHIDKLGGKIQQEFFDEKTYEWRKAQDAARGKIRALEETNCAYIDDGIKLLELSRKAAELYSRQVSDEKRKLLKIIHSNSTFCDGKLTTNFRKPFDLLALTNGNFKIKVTASHAENGHFDFWLPELTNTENWQVTVDISEEMMKFRRVKNRKFP